MKLVVLSWKSRNIRNVGDVIPSLPREKQRVSDLMFGLVILNKLITL